MPLYEVSDGTRIRLIEAHSPAGAESFVRESIDLKVSRADYERVHELALKGIRIEGKERAAQPAQEATES